MIADYKYRITRDQSQSFNWLYFALTIIILLQFAFIIYRPPTTVTNSVSDFPSEKVIATEEVDKVFQFYYMLPNNTEIVLPDYEVNTRSREGYFGKGGDKIYSIQAGSFRRIEEANRLSQRLVHLGMAPEIERHKNIWNRVMINRLPILDVQAKKKALKEHGIDALVIEKISL